MLKDDILSKLSKVGELLDLLTALSKLLVQGLTHLSTVVVFWHVRTSLAHLRPCGPEGGNSTRSRGAGSVRMLTARPRSVAHSPCIVILHWVMSSPLTFSKANPAAGKEAQRTANIVITETLILVGTFRPQEHPQSL